MKFRKKPVEVEAIQYFPGQNCDEIAKFLGVLEHDDSACSPDAPWFIPTLEGMMVASPGDWIIRGDQGEFYPCKPDIFEQTYEPVE